MTPTPDPAQGARLTAELKQMTAEASPFLLSTQHAGIWVRKNLDAIIAALSPTVEAGEVEELLQALTQPVGEDEEGEAFSEFDMRCARIIRSQATALARVTAELSEAQKEIRALQPRAIMFDEMAPTLVKMGVLT